MGMKGASAVWRAGGPPWASAAGVVGSGRQRLGAVPRRGPLAPVEPGGGFMERLLRHPKNWREGCQVAAGPQLQPGAESGVGRGPLGAAVVALASLTERWWGGSLWHRESQGLVRFSRWRAWARQISRHWCRARLPAPGARGRVVRPASGVAQAGPGAWARCDLLRQRGAARGFDQPGEATGRGRSGLH